MVFRDQIAHRKYKRRGEVISRILKNKLEKKMKEGITLLNMIRGNIFIIRVIFLNLNLEIGFEKTSFKSPYLIIK